MLLREVCPASHQTLLREVCKLVGPSNVSDKGASDAASSFGEFTDETLLLQCEYRML